MDGKRLKQLRLGKGFSLTKLSECTGISKSYLSLIERNIQRNPSLEILNKLATLLEVDMEELVKKEDSESTNSTKGKYSVKSILKVEIELSEEQLSPQKLKQIKELIHVISEC
ncbi:helix-turn-helix transcriptional regulator [Neobacillus sp. PS2-9]|uniref:helix-turn-helix domain-containing protein n=1 Tax=Neobacillus sp. PS2-9 TaxID=3070676 RepID=UPI0027E00F95|nr:helix-turn-helix transcriptional regulator [Neobacillus sp. PS2-9]WML59152.1 helix-turn-helix transcriptional regulator [Neobacillus sp. PS2-9]